MGNGQSVEAPRRVPNKLSKPRTTPSTNPLTSKPTGPPSRRSSHLDDAVKRRSVMSLNFVGGEERHLGDSTQRKRSSMFRSKSVPPESEFSQINTGVNVEYLARRTLDNWSPRRPSTDVSPIEQYHVPPVER